MQLREHQIDVIEKARTALMNGNKRPIIFAPCSFGKTIVAAEISRLASEKEKKVLFLVHRRLLCIQTKEKFDDYGLHSSIIMAGYETDLTANVMITTVQTYSRRLELDHPFYNQFFHDADLVFVDECHFGISKTYLNIYKYYEDKPIIGLTGSPARGDQRGLGEVFDHMVESVGISDLTEKGYLAPVRYFAADPPDLSDVKTVMGDYSKPQLEKKMNKVKLVGDVVENWLKLGKNRQTIVFATGVKHSIHLRDQFLKHGIPSEHLDSNSPHDERLDVLRRFKDGDIKVVVNCQLFTEGYDADFVECIAIARPTKSLPLWIQMAGRGQRICHGKKDCILLDFGGNIERHGFLDEKIEWSLDGKELAWKKSKHKKIKKPVKCTACNYVFEGSGSCPECGSPVKTFGRKIDTEDGELKELKGKKKHTTADKRQYLGMLRYWVAEKGYNPKMVNAKYKNRFEVWPGNGIKDVLPIQPDQEFLNLMKHDMIRYAKSKEKANGRGAAEIGSQGQMAVNM